VEILDKAKCLTSNEKALNAIERLEELYGSLAKQGLEKYISFDLGMVSMYHYYTGIIFRAYTYGTGDAVATGGRYDKLLAQFGKDSPAVGFGLNLDQLMIAMSRQKLPVLTNHNEIFVIYERSCYDRALEFAQFLRKKGIFVQMNVHNTAYSTNDYLLYAKRVNADELYYFGPASVDGIIEVAEFMSETWTRNELSVLKGAF